MRREWNKCGSRTWNHAVLVFYTVFFYTGFLHLHATDVCSSCHINATCTTKNGTKTCDCNYGFFGNGITFCSDKDECQIGSEKICGLHAACYNTHGSYYCTCNEGYKPSNNMDLFTPNDGTHCTAINCGTSPILQNTLRYPPVNTTYGNTVTYQCAHGYEYVTGNTSLICSILGHWEGQYLECEVIDCGSPPVLENTVQLPLENTTYNSTVTYKCLTGYVYAGGNTTLVCSAQGQWEGLKLECKAVNCGSPPVLPNTVRYLPGNTTYGSTVKYHCVDGHVRVTGNSSLLCSAQGQWEGPKLECEAVNCGSPPVLPNTVRYLPGNTTYGSTVKYHCVDGHVRVTGNSSLLCSAQGQWEGPKLECEAVDCGSAPELQNAVRYSLGNTTYGSTVEYQCLAGHVHLRGNGTLVCSARGQWEGPDLECEAVDCGSPPAIANTLRNPPPNTTYGSTAVYQCLPGFDYVRGNSALVCSAQGLWEGQSMNCQVVDCGSPPSLENTLQYPPRNTTYGSKTKYTCLAGYLYIRGNTTLVCSAQGQWEGARLECEAVDCGTPAPIPNAWSLRVRETTYGTEIQYRCRTGFVRGGGNGTMICSETGQWEGAHFNCSAVDCGTPAPIPNAWSLRVRETTYGTEIQYRCRTGFMRGGGNGTMICSKTGQWEGAHFNCSEIDCGIPPVVPHAKMASYHSTRLGSVAHYRCRDGFYAVSGSNVSTCKQEGQWEEITLVCQVNDFILYNKSCLKWKRDGLGTRSEDTYLFQIQGERVYQREFFYKKLFNYSTADDSPAICLDLQAGTNYTVNITALTSHHSACIQLSTAVTDPPIPDIQVLVVEQILPPLILRRVESKNGPISLYQVIVLPLNLQHSFNCNSQNIRDFFDHQKDTEAYITAEFIAMDVKDGMQFSVGDRLYYRDFYNAALEAGKNYSFLLKIISEWNYVKKQSCVTLAQLKGVSRQDNSRDAKYYIVLRTKSNQIIQGRTEGPYMVGSVDCLKRPYTEASTLLPTACKRDHCNIPKSKGILSLNQSFKSDDLVVNTRNSCGILSLWIQGGLEVLKRMIFLPVWILLWICCKVIHEKPLRSFNNSALNLNK
ncbi:sushi domain-containing protein 1 isoform X5 [Mobula hypostoma]|uniref:sushi domain-containing protein 1 isoform X5 n=1 Tax=Mobula hypostoma TaxID=723540 RepID=UPI002FC2C082